MSSETVNLDVFHWKNRKKTEDRMEHLPIEKLLWERGYQRIACCDEVGRGCLFGDVVAAAVVLPPYLHIEGVKDSKKISEKKREKLYDLIMDQALAVGIGTVTAAEIDMINIKQAARKAMVSAVNQLKTKNGIKFQPDYLLIDAETLDLQYPQQALIKGEDQSHGIAAASIIAKVYRDRLCQQWHDEHPDYGLDRHKGYGTRQHRDALLRFGATSRHRQSFLKKILKEQQGK
ncbi:MAG: ribonuclease HII [Tindallia sp. MSAO_Bac2]|nr:MAG: ribonuclease HII [Tindallia sp. MSAO_Bac2]